MTKERDAGATGHQPFLQLAIGDTAFVDPGVVGSGDSLGDGVLIFTKGSGEADERGQAAVCEVVQPAGEGCRVMVVEHGGETADQVVSLPEFRAVVEEPGQTVVDVGAASVRVGGDPAGGLTRGGRSLARFVQGQATSEGCDGHLHALVLAEVAISDNRADFGVKRICRVLGASRAGYYRHLATVPARAERQAEESGR